MCKYVFLPRRSAHFTKGQKGGVIRGLRHRTGGVRVSMYVCVGVCARVLDWQAFVTV